VRSTFKKVKEGSELVIKTNEAFTQVAESSSRVGELVGEIAAASNEQAQGINHVNTAVTEMDRVTQQNAANAEESTSASEEMNAQSEQMKLFVKELVELAGGTAEKMNGRKLIKFGRKKPDRMRNIPTETKKTRTYDLTDYKRITQKPEEIIPINGDDDFKDL